MRRLVQLVISVGLTVLIGYIIYREVPDWGQAWHVMMQGRPLLLLAGLGFVTVHILLRAARWGVLLKPVKPRISYKNLFSLTLVKYVVNVVPPRAGEVAASVVLAKKEDISATSVIAASVLERILDTAAVLVLFGFYFVIFSHRYAPNTERGKEILLTVRDYSIKGFIVFCIAFAVLALLLRGKSWMTRIPVRIRKIVFSFLEGFRALQSRGAVIQVVVMSLAIWLCITMQLWCLVLAYLDTFPFAGTLFLMALTVVGVSIPTPGGVGGFQFFMNLALVNFFPQFLSTQDPHSQAAGISNGCYLVSMMPVIIVGLVFLNREGLSLNRLFRLSEQVREESAPVAILEQ